MTIKTEQINEKKTNHLSYLLLVIGTALFLVGNGRWIIPAATWLFPIFIIRFLRTKRHPLNTVLCALAYIGMLMIAWYGLLDAPGILYYLITGGVGLIMFLPFLVDKIFAARMTGFWTTLVFPLAYTTVEYVFSLVNPYGTWTFLGYTQFGNLPLMQIVSITGIFGITFLITWFGSVVNWVWEQKFEWSKIGQGIKIYASVMVVVLLFGGVSLVFFSPKSNEVKVAGVQSDLPSKIIDPQEIEKRESIPAKIEYLIPKHKIVIDDLFTKSKGAAQSGARIVSWSEVSVMVFKADEPAFIDRGKQLAKEEQIYLVLAYGAILHTDETLLPGKKMVENKVVIISPTGEVLSTYLKTNPVPGSEAMMSVIGTNDIPVIDTPYGRLSVTICFENDFPAFTRKVGMAGVDILINPSGDWIEIDPYHTQIQAFRAIENGFSTVRITARGLSAAYDYQGRTLATMDYFRTEDLVFTAYVPENGVTTIYSQIGDVFSWLCVAGFIAVSGKMLIKKKRSDLA